MTLFHRRTLFAFVLGAALATAVFVGRAAHATSNEINACFKPSNGTLYLLGEGSGRYECQPGDIPISWSSSGVNGRDGVSVTSQVLAPGDDAACPNGGSKFTAVSGVTHACNGTNGVDGVDGTDGQDGDDGASVTNQALAPGDDAACPNGGTKFTSANAVSYACNGTNGSNGQDGDDFSGTFTSPDGRFKLVVDNAGARLEGPNNAKVQIVGNGVEIGGPFGSLKLLQSGATLDSPTNLTLHAQVLFSASGLLTAIGGTQQIALNGNGCGLLRGTDVNPIIGPTGGATLLNPNGSPTVRTSC
jgi:hypothetical protein